MAKEAEKTEKKVARRKYSVAPHCGIFVTDPDSGETVKCSGGETVHLTAAEAKHFKSLNQIEPFIEDDEDEDEE